MLDSNIHSEDDTRSNLRAELLKALERAKVEPQAREYLTKPENIEKLNDQEIQALIDSYNQEADKRAETRGKIEGIAEGVSKGFASDIEEITRRRIAEAKGKNAK